MSEVVGYLRGINKELEGVLEAVNAQEWESFLHAVAGAGKIALYGVGREGLVMRAFAMRLFHLGYNVSVVGDMTAPHLGAGDLLIVSAGPGYFSTVDGLRRSPARWRKGALPDRSARRQNTESLRPCLADSRPDYGE